MSIPELPSTVKVQYEGCFVIIKPLVDMDESGRNLAPAGEYTCFVMQKKPGEPLGPPTSPGLDGSVPSPEPYDPGWGTTEHFSEGGEAFKSVEEALKHGKDEINLRTKGVV
jgi:hypothetical protein